MRVQSLVWWRGMVLWEGAEPGVVGGMVLCEGAEPGVVEGDGAV